MDIFSNAILIQLLTFAKFLSSVKGPPYIKPCIVATRSRSLMDFSLRYPRFPLVALANSRAELVPSLRTAARNRLAGGKRTQFLVPY
jgi:hypothetical protein